VDQVTPSTIGEFDFPVVWFNVWKFCPLGGARPGVFCGDVPLYVHELLRFAYISVHIQMIDRAPNFVPVTGRHGETGPGHGRSFSLVI